MPPVFIITLLTITKTWKQPKRPSTAVWMKKMWCVCVCVYVYTHTHTHTKWNITQLKKRMK